MLLNSRASLRRIVLLAIAGVCILSMLGLFTFKPKDEQVQTSRIKSTNLGPLSRVLRQTLLEDLIRDIYAPHVLSFAQPVFQDIDGTNYTIPEDPTFQEALRGKLCIVDFDTTPLDDPNEAFGWTRLDFESMAGISPGIFNHYLYSMIHGYSHHFIHISKPPDRLTSWVKVSDMVASFFTCDVVVAIEPDYVFQHLEIPFEWLLNRWNVTKDIAVAMPLESTQRDQGRPRKNHYKADSRGRIPGNTGFVTIQRIDQVFDLMDAWKNCPTGEKYPGCKKFATQEPAEMGAFAEFIRYDFADHIREFPCEEGNGEPGTECSGVFVRRYRSNEALLKQGVTNSIMQSLFEIMHADMLRSRPPPVQD